jgi:hypothetical protein
LAIVHADAAMRLRLRYAPRRRQCHGDEKPNDHLLSPLSVNPGRFFLSGSLTDPSPRNRLAPRASNP